MTRNYRSYICFDIVFQKSESTITSKYIQLCMMWVPRRVLGQKDSRQEYFHAFRSRCLLSYQPWYCSSCYCVSIISLFYQFFFHVDFALFPFQLLYFLHHFLLFCNLSRGSFRKSLATSHEVVIMFAYTLSFPDLTCGISVGMLLCVCGYVV